MHGWKLDADLVTLSGCQTALGKEAGGEGYIGPVPKAEALREAKRWLRATTDHEGRQPFLHPAYWAGFGLIGGGT